MEILIMLALALAADLTLGEMPTPIHPVGWMGRLASFFEKPGSKGSPSFQFIYGALLTLFMAGLFAGAGYFILTYLKRQNTRD